MERATTYPASLQREAPLQTKEVERLIIAEGVEPPPYSRCVWASGEDGLCWAEMKYFHQDKKTIYTEGDNVLPSMTKRGNRDPQMRGFRERKERGNWKPQSAEIGSPKTAPRPDHSFDLPGPLRSFLRFCAPS